MNILFLLKTLEVGGVEIVTITLANKFVSKGHHVCFFVRGGLMGDLYKQINEDVHIYEGFGNNEIINNVKYLHEVYVKERIQLVVNQWGLPFMPVLLAKIASIKHPVKIISFHHNSPSANGKIASCNLKILKNRHKTKDFFYKICRFFLRIITSLSMRFVYDNSDYFALLSFNYIPEFSRFTGVRNPSKLVVLPNPVTLNVSEDEYENNLKRKELLFVGRIDNIQKRVDRIITTWSYLEKEHTDWSLVVVGDGPDRKEIEMQIKKLGLKNVRIEGYKNPINYYKSASLLILTSEYEGFPLVLEECMSFGVVPCVYDSFLALSEIVKHGSNGVILKRLSGDFNPNTMAKLIAELMENPSRLKKMSDNAIRASKNFSIDSVYGLWDMFFTKIS